MRTFLVAGALIAAGGVGCGSTGPAASSQEAVASTASPIQGGSDDPSHTFAVGVVQDVGGQVALCSGVLLAPNLVATARHCVSRLTSTQIDCATSAFTGTVAASSLFVTTQETVPMTQSGYYAVATNGVVVPPATGVCGNDIALLILTSNIPMAQYVTPIINPPMTDHHTYTTAYTAIGYGVDSPTDTNGASAGTRRIKENINLTCIPNDTSFVDCFAFAGAQNVLSPNEFEGGDGTCEGDSGSGAYDQGSFNGGSWAAFGVLSRGGVSAEGGTCIGGIYTRFDKWGALVMQAGAEAAAAGGYAPAAWVNASSTPVSVPEAGSPPAVPDAAPTACLLNGGACGQDTDCCSVNCEAVGSGPFTCVACDDVHLCSPNYGCVQGVCVYGRPSASPPPAGGGDTPSDAGGVGTIVVADAGLGTRVSGCAIASSPGDPRQAWSNLLAVALGSSSVVLRRRRRLRRPPRRL